MGIYMSINTQLIETHTILYSLIIYLQISLILFSMLLTINPTTDTLLNTLIRIQYYVIFRLRSILSQ